ncbi:MAG: Flp family type IVb pilin [Sideroxydans sp.]|nr:Flp family type IVb pilin [Sideroxydans sp.]
MLYWIDYVRSWMRSEEGQDIIEYALMVVLVAVVGVILFGTIGGSIKNIWTEVQNVVTTAAGQVTT